MSSLLKLPLSVERILHRIQAEDDDFRARRTAKTKQIQSTRREKADAQTRLHRLEAADREGRLVRENHSENDGRDVVTRVRDTAAIDSVRAEIAEYDRRLAELDSSEFPERLTAARIESVLASLGKHAEFVEVERPSLPFRKNERPADALLRIRADNDVARAELKALERRPGSLADAKRANREAVAALVRVPQISGLFHGNGIRWPVCKVYVKANQQPTVIDGAGLLAFAFREELIKRIDSLLELNASAFPDAISESDRAAQIAELAARIAEGDRIEAACVEAVIAEGGEAYYRPHVDVLTALGIAAVA